MLLGVVDIVVVADIAVDSLVMMVVGVLVHRHHSVAAEEAAGIVVEVAAVAGREPERQLEDTLEILMVVAVGSPVGAGQQTCWELRDRIGQDRGQAQETY